jgi:superfamily II DNA or RNA helicase/HKD family nuclease
VEHLPPGIYDLLRTSSLDRRGTRSSRRGQGGSPVEARLAKLLDPSPGKQKDAGALAQLVASELARILESHDDEAVRAQLTNRLLELAGSDERVPVPIEFLVAVANEATGPLPHPETPLGEVALLTAARNERSMFAELASEIPSADRIDIIMAFVRWAGVRMLAEPLKAAAARGVPIRLLTTTYTGSTQRMALDWLVREAGAHVAISYETQATRLHAKAWLFGRDSGFDTAYVGSSNLTTWALVDGLEWNVRLVTPTTPHLIERFRRTFDGYLASDVFEPYDPDRDGERLDRALRVAGASDSGDMRIELSGLEVTPRPHQQAILEALEAERTVHDRHRNLVVAATGTGKTVVAALDYRALAEQWGRRPSLLFVAHRREILDQSLRTYREVLVDGTFGESFVGGVRPREWQHVFASVQSLSSGGMDRLDLGRFEIVVIDEFHHAEAATYRALLERVQPQELLGLTATPERTDGVDVREFFDGRAAYEMRLWDAMDERLLVPFHYFGIHDNVDLRSVEWRRGGYVLANLSELYTGHDARVRLVIEELRKKVGNLAQMRALGFCVSVEHAHFMSDRFNAAGIDAVALSGATPDDERAAAIAALRNGRTRAIFAVDLFNEGLDIPEIDTLLLLRPTESATLFLQQLGRGLRRTHGKSVLTVLDFIGQQRREFRFDAKMMALTGASRREVAARLDQDHPWLPGGSAMQLDRVAKEIVVASVRDQLDSRLPRLVTDARSIGTTDLATFLAESGHDLPAIYRNRGARTQSWTLIERAARLDLPPAGPHEEQVARRVRSLVHVDDARRADAYQELLAPHGPRYELLGETHRRIARMLCLSIWPDRDGRTYPELLDRLRSEPAIVDEIGQVLQLGVDSSRLAPGGLGDGLSDVPLDSHAHYTRPEILAAFGLADEERSARGRQAGVEWARAHNAVLLLVNLRKDEADFSPTTMYRDYALGERRFHWESQNDTALDSRAGRELLDPATRVVLFVRESPSNDFGKGAPFLCLGRAHLVPGSVKGERPIAMVWELERPMPAATYEMAAAAAV